MKVLLVDNNEVPVDITKLFTDLAAAIAAMESGPGDPVDLTYTETVSYTQLETLIGTSAVEINKTYVVTDAFGNKAILFLKGATATTLYPNCYGRLLNAQMSEPVFGLGEYDFATDTLLRFRDPLKDNEIFGAHVPTFPFDADVSGFKTEGGMLRNTKIVTIGYEAANGAQAAPVDLVVPIGINNTLALIDAMVYVPAALANAFGCGFFIEIASGPALTETLAMDSQNAGVVAFKRKVNSASFEETLSIKGEKLRLKADGSGNATDGEIKIILIYGEL